MNINPIILATIEIMDKDQLRKILTTRKEYVVVHTHIFNAGSYVKVRFTDNYNYNRRIRDVSGYDYVIESFYLKRYIRDWAKKNNIPIL